MKHLHSTAAAIIVALGASAASAQMTPPDATPTPSAATPDKPATAAAPAAPTPALTFSGGATLTSDYRFRGISQTDKKIAIQGTGTITHSSGLYASFWSSSIDTYTAYGSHLELDLIGGYKKPVSGYTVDGGMLYYVYPANNGNKTNFFEPYISASRAYGPIGAKLGGNFAWKQTALRTAPGNASRGGAYGYGELSLAVPKSPITVTGHVGHSFVKNYITFDTHYTDWSLTAAATFKQFTASVAYVDTDKSLFSYPAGGGQNRNVSQSGIVGAIGFAF